MDVFEDPEVLWILLARILLCGIILRVGYMLVQIGENPATFHRTIIDHNIAELVVTYISFSVVGSRLIFTSEEERTSDFDNIIVNDDRKNDRVAITIYAWTAVAAATTIVTAATSSRIHIVGHVILTAVIAGVIHPLFMRWTWNSDSFMKDVSFFTYNVSYLDCGSFSHVHLLAGTVALFTGTFLATCDLGQESYHISSTQDSIQINIGYFLVMLGTIGLTIPLTSSQTDIETSEWTVFFPESYESLVTNNGIAALGGCSVSSLFQLVFFASKDRSLVRDLQAALAGMVTASSAIYLFTPLTSLVIGAIGGFTFLVAHSVTSDSYIDGHCKIVITHMVCGFVGSLYPKKMTELSLVFGTELLVNCLWEFVCNLALYAMLNASIVLILVTLDHLGFANGKRCAQRVDECAGKIVAV